MNDAVLLLLEAVKMEAEIIDTLFVELLQYKNIEDMEYLSRIQEAAELLERIGE